MFGAPLVLAVIFYMSYKIIELFARRRERLGMIDKISENMTPEMIEKQLQALGSFPKSSFTSLKIGCLLIGIGAGLLVGYTTYKSYGLEWGDKEMVVGASVLLCGGISLLIAFVLELILTRKKD